MTVSELRIFKTRYNQEYKISLLEENGFALSDLEKQIIMHEDFLLSAYECKSGVLTVGVGHTAGVKQNTQVTIMQAVQLLRDDIRVATNDCCKLFPQFYEFCRFRQMALINMSFNLGYSRFENFKKTIKYINNHQWAFAAVEMLNSRWHREQVGQRAVDLAFEIVGKIERKGE